MANAKKIEAVLETRRVVTQPERVVLELTLIEAHAIARLCALAGGGGRLRDATDRVLSALSGADVDSGHLAYQDECRQGYSPAASSFCWFSEGSLPYWQIARINALASRSEAAL